MGTTLREPCTRHFRVARWENRLLVGLAVLEDVEGAVHGAVAKALARFQLVLGFRREVGEEQHALVDERVDEIFGNAHEVGIQDAEPGGAAAHPEEGEHLYVLGRQVLLSVRRRLGEERIDCTAVITSDVRHPVMMTRIGRRGVSAVKPPRPLHALRSLPRERRGAAGRGRAPRATRSRARVASPPCDLRRKAPAASTSLRHSTRTSVCFHRLLVYRASVSQLSIMFDDTTAYTLSAHCHAFVRHSRCTLERGARACY